MSLFRLLSEKLHPGLFSAKSIVYGLPSFRHPASQLQMQKTAFSTWSVRADRRHEERRKSDQPVFLDTRCTRDRRNTGGRRWLDKHGEQARSGIDIYV